MEILHRRAQVTAFLCMFIRPQIAALCHGTIFMGAEAWFLSFSSLALYLSDIFTNGIFICGSHDLRISSLHAWNPFSRRPLAVWLSAFLVCLVPVKIVGFFSQAVHDAWIKTTWPQATATIVGPWQEVANDRSGRRFDAPLLATRPDGKTVIGQPIRAFPIALPPALGHELPVRLKPSDPSRMMVEGSMVQNFLVQAAVNLLIFAVMAHLLFQFFRGNVPRLWDPEGWVAGHARRLVAKVRNRQAGGAPPGEAL